MPKLEWDVSGQKTFETGVDHAVLYRYTQSTNKYDKASPWNGITSITESPSGAEANPQYADNIKYLNLISAEDFGGTIEAFTYPDEFAYCDGSAELVPGIMIGQQNRETFGLSYRTKVGNDTVGQDYGYKLHFIYGCLASVSERVYSTINDSPEANTFSWEFTTTPVNVKDLKPTAIVTIDTTKLDENGKQKLKDLEDKLYGTEESEAYLPLPDEIKEIFAAG